MPSVCFPHRAQQKQEIMKLSLRRQRFTEESSFLSKAWTESIPSTVEYIMFPIKVFLFFISLTSKDQTLPFTLAFKSSDDSKVWVEGICHRYCLSFSFKKRICERHTAEWYKSHPSTATTFSLIRERERNCWQTIRTDGLFSDMSACLYCQLSGHYLSLLPAPWVKPESGTEKGLCQVNYSRKLQTLSWDHLCILLWCLQVTLSNPVLTGVEAPQN